MGSFFVKVTRCLQLSTIACLALGCSAFIFEETFGKITYYVSPSGDDRNPGTSAEPFATIQKAADTVNPGDTVVVRDGTYTRSSGAYVINVTRGGTSGAWVTFRSENKWGAKVDAQGGGRAGATSRFSGRKYSWNIAANYVRVEDFDIYGGNYGGIWSNMENHDIYIYRNKIHDVGRWNGCPDFNYGRAGIYQGPKTYNHTYDSNVFHTIGRLPQGTPNRTWYRDTYGVDEDCTKHYYQHDHGIYLNQTRNAIIKNNIFYDLKAGWSVQAANNSNVTIINNTMATNRPGDGGHISLGGANNTVTIQNNVFYDPGTHACVIKDLSYWYGNPPDGGIVISNNITNITYSGSTFLTRWVNPVGTATPRAASFAFSNNLEQDMKLVDAPGYDFHLLSDSPAIDSGSDSNSPPAVDYDGNPRPAGARYDMGAYEFIRQ